jgi:hypothetical protein
MEAGTASAAAEGLREVLGEQTERADGLQADLARERSSSAKLQAAERKLQVQSCSCTRTPSPPPPLTTRGLRHTSKPTFTSPVHPPPRQYTLHLASAPPTIHHQLTIEMQAQLHAQTDAAEAAARREAASEEAVRSLRASSTDLEKEISALRSEMAQREEEFQARAVAIVSRRRGPAPGASATSPEYTCDGYTDTYDLPGRAQPLHREA